MMHKWLRGGLAAVGLAVVVYGGLAALQGTVPLATYGAAVAQEAVAELSGTAPALPMNPAGRLAPLGFENDAEIWRQVRSGIRGQVPIPDLQSGVLVQSEGDNWRSFRNGPLVKYGWWSLALVVAVLALFFAFRGRVRIDKGWAGTTIERFNGFERFVHWLTAGSFVVLAVTGLNMLYGRYLFTMGGPGATGNFSSLHTSFAAFTSYGKLVHNFIGFSFTVGVALMFVIWVRHNLPSKHDVVWLLKAGGLLTRGSHPPARKFNAGQKLIFWTVVIGGISVIWSGVGLMFTYQITPFAETFLWLNGLGFSLPTSLTPLEEMQLMQLWHGAVAIVFIAVILAHIYIGTLGMEGAFDAMGTGQVDTNWAEEHHSLWVEEVKAAEKDGDGGAKQPAE